MTHAEEEKWNRRYRKTDASVPQPALVLTRYAHLLPEQGRALDLAAGLGGNALLLAHHGLETHAWDISSAAMERLSVQAKSEGVKIECEVRDVVQRPPLPESFDVIVVSRFLERELCPALAAALRPGGLLFYQTFLRDRADPEFGPRNPAYLLGQNELLRLFDTLIVRAYHEEGTLGDPDHGTRNEALLVAQRPL